MRSEIPEELAALVNLLNRNTGTIREFVEHPWTPDNIKADFTAIHDLVIGIKSGNPVTMAMALSGIEVGREL